MRMEERSEFEIRRLGHWTMTNIIKQCIYFIWRSLFDGHSKTALLVLIEERIIRDIQDWRCVLVRIKHVILAGYALQKLHWGVQVISKCERLSILRRLEGHIDILSILR